MLFTGDIWEGFGPGPFSMAGGVTYREQWFFQCGLPQQIEAYGPPVDAPSIGIRGFHGGFTTGSPNLHEFSTVPAIKGGYDVWETFTEFNLPLWESEIGQPAARDRCGRSPLRLLDERRNQVVEDRHQPPGRGVRRFRTTVSRDVREPTFAERFNVQGGGGNTR